MRFIIIFLLLSIVTNAQSTFYESCKEAEKAAITDFKKGRYISRIHGLESTDDFDLEVYYETYLYSKYNIEIAHMGCIIMDGDLCYSKRQDSLIKIKFGKDVFSNTRKIAESQYKTLSTFEKAKILDTDKVYGMMLLDSQAKFIGNDKYVEECLKNSFIRDLDKVFINDIYLVINEDGTIGDYYASEEYFITNKSKKELLLELNSLGTWVPAYLFGKKVKSRYRLFLNI